MESKVKGPAIGLIVIAAGSALVSLLDVVGQLTGATTIDPAQLEGIPPEFQEFLVSGGPVLSLAFALLTWIVSGFVVFSALKMMRLEGWGLAVAASIVVMIPFLTNCCCCLFGIPVGIWSLVVLMNEEVKQAFR